MTSEPTRRSLDSFIALLAGAGALAYLWFGWCMFPSANWNEIRLAPAFALRHGLILYPGAEGGPLSTWIYGPIGLLVNLPATFARSAVGAVLVAGTINLVVLVAPLAVICLGSADLKTRGAPTRWFVLALGVLLLPATSLQYQTPDHAAIALGLLSCFCLAQPDRPSHARLIAAAALAALAVWTKQIAVFIVLAQAAWLFVRGERGGAARYLAWAAFFGVALLLVSLFLFGFSGLWLNLVEIPGRLPWGDVRDKLLRRVPQLVLQLGFSALLLVLLRRRHRWPGRESETGRFLSLALGVAVAFLPIGLVSFFKVGGDLNSLHCWFYLAPALCLAWFTRDVASARAKLALLAVVLLVRTPDFSTPATPGPGTAALAVATRLARDNPGALWFPYNPLVTFYADGKFYHVEDGVATRHLAGLGLHEANFRRYLPEHLTGVAYPANHTDHFALQLLPGFNQRMTAGPWAVYARATR